MDIYLPLYETEDGIKTAKKNVLKLIDLHHKIFLRHSIKKLAKRLACPIIRDNEDLKNKN